MSKIQFNATTFKANRDKLSKYYNAVHDLVQTQEKLTDSIKAAEKSLADVRETATSENALIDDEGIAKTIATLEARIKKLTDDLDKAKAKAKKQKEDALALVTDDLYNGYADSTSNFAQVIANWFISLGLPDATAEACDEYTRYIGTRDRNSTKKEKRTTGRITAGLTKTKFAPLWIAALCDDLLDAKVINPFKYTYIPESMKKKTEKK